MSLILDAAGLTDVGLVRASNEDSFGYNERLGIFVVCDGMGGHAAGEVASRIYLLRYGQFLQLTEDHSLVMEQVRRGMLTLEEAKRSSAQNIITRALG